MARRHSNADVPGQMVVAATDMGKGLGLSAWWGMEEPLDALMLTIAPSSPRPCSTSS